VKKIRIPLFVIGVLVVLPTAAQTNLEDIQEKGVIRLGVANEAPYGYQAPDGRMTGEAPEIARKILEKIDPDIQVEGVVVPFNDLISDLNAGRFDVIAAGMFITPARCRQIAFTDPTYKIGEALAVKAGNPKNLTDFDSIAKQPDARLAVMAGAVEYGYAYEAGVFVDQVSVYPSYQEALEALQGGRIDAIAMTSLSVRDLVGQNPGAGIEATPQFFPVLDGEPVAGYGAFGFRKEDQALRAAFNQHLTDFIGTDAHWETVRPFGFVPDMAPNKGVAELCQE
jgi:polar amino acid transport system substrate-binding protein